MHTTQHWTAIVSGIVIAFYKLTPVIAGVICLCLVRSLPTAARLLKSASTLIYVYLCCRLAWSVVQVVIDGLAFSRDGDVVATGAAQALAMTASSVAFLLLVGWGTAELAFQTWLAGRLPHTDSRTEGSLPE